MRSFDRALANGRSIRVRCTDRSDGDFAIGGADTGLDERRRQIIDRPWVWLRQVHGRECRDVDVLGIEGVVGAAADAAVTSSAQIALCVQTADCVPLVLWSDEGVIAAVHVGWRGLEAGIVEETLRILREKTVTSLSAFIGPSIGPECYAFGVDDLDRLRQRFGSVVAAHTRTGEPALDVRSAVRSLLQDDSVAIERDDDACTSCVDGFFSHRARADTERQTTVIWIEEL